jgi:hypothetical protein
VTDDKRDELIIDMHGKVTQMYGVLYENGLVAKVEDMDRRIRDGYQTCPIAKEIAAHLDEHKNRKYSVPVWVVVIMGVAGLGIPFFYKLVGAL